MNTISTRALDLVTRIELQASLTGNAGEFIEGFAISATRTPTGKITFRLGLLGKAIPRARLLVRLTSMFEEQDARAAVAAKTIPCKAQVSYQPGFAPTVTLTSDRMLAVDSGKGYSHYFHVGAVPVGGCGRKVDGGPLVNGPWAYAFGAATVICASKAMQEHDAAKRADAIPVVDGSKVIVDTIEYTVAIDPRGPWIKLV